VMLCLFYDHRLLWERDEEIENPWPALEALVAPPLRADVPLCPDDLTFTTLVYYANLFRLPCGTFAIVYTLGRSLTDGSMLEEMLWTRAVAHLADGLRALADARPS